MIGRKASSQMPAVCGEPTSPHGAHVCAEAAPAGADCGAVACEVAERPGIWTTSAFGECQYSCSEAGVSGVSESGLDRAGSAARAAGCWAAGWAGCGDRLRRLAAAAEPLATGAGGGLDWTGSDDGLRETG